jgi:hypothetical protein
MKPLLSR